MKRFLRLVTVLSLLAVFAGGLLSAQAARPAPAPHRGVWTADDIDGSDLQLVVVGGRSGTYRLIWLDNYWSLCDGRRGIGRGTGTLDASDSNVLHTTMIFRCAGGETTLFAMDFTYDPGTDTMMNDGPGAVHWFRR